MKLKIILLLTSFLVMYFSMSAQHTCTATSCPLPDENIDSIKIEMAKQIKLNEERFTKAALKISIIKVENNRFGYQIMADERMIIEEKTIPAISGYYGFINEFEAKMVAEFAIQKIKNGEMPPSISIEDLERMNISL